MQKRVLYLHPHFTLPGGAGRHTLETGHELAQRGWDVHVASISHKDSLVSDYSALTFHALGGALPSSLLYWLSLPIRLRQVHRLIATLQPDIVFSQVFPANWWGFYAKRKLRHHVKHVWMCQEPSAFIHSRRWIQALPKSPAGLGARALNRPLKAIDTTLARYVDYVFANSQFSRALTVATYSYNPRDVGICYPGVDTTRFVPDIHGRKKFFQFVACSRLTRFKNIDRVLKAFALIPRDDVTLQIIGDGEEYDSLTDLSRALGLSTRVAFRRTVSDAEMIQTLQESVGLIHAAEEEPFGLAPVEAMACGTPVIAIQGGGPAETIVHHATGYLCPDASEQSIQLGIEWIIQNSRSNESMQAACVQRAQRFTWHQSVDALEAVFFQLLSERYPAHMSANNLKL